jgi:multidrug efflux pump subunit AcrB
MTETNRSVTVTLSADDYAIANKLFVLNSAKTPAVLATLALLVILYVLLLIAPSAGYALGELGQLVRDIALAILILAVAISLLNYLFLAPYAARSTYQKQKTLHYPVTFSWSEAGLKATGSNGEWTVPWGDYLKLAENAQIILFYQSPRLFQMLPKRVLEAEQVTDLLRCAASVRR